MAKKKTKKQSDKEMLAEVTKEMAKPRVAMSARKDSPPSTPLLGAHNYTD